MIFFKSVLNFLRDRNYRHLLMTTIVILLAGSVVFHYLEGWDYVDALYFSIITLTTIGYGDFTPQTTGGKLFTIFYIIVGIGIILAFINTIYTHYRTITFREDKGHTRDKD
ncbi:potassium channel family protein [Membranicola marinus]|uniref:Potassium channel family protein n=1 Tax=Membranihabitans marinus TaxID=1227546 RepID=A0A953HNK2_9BACT|nr:potassium channel family protein [Membranihabitans marinus]MBY5959274.1 potassium channel family protein [Membranihabitans marinus]